MVNDSILKGENIHLRFGNIYALEDISFEVSSKEIFAIIGPNGAGKTSLLNCINGFYHAQKGTILFQGQPITYLAPHRVAELGIARTFQNLALYPGMTTGENLMAGRHLAMKQNFIAQAFYFGPALNEEVRQRKVVEEIIDFLEITAFRSHAVGALPYGLRKRIDLGRALALEPKMLLLDEPMAGMNVEEKEDMARFIIDIFEIRQIPIVIVEHDMGLVMDICDRVCVLEMGRKIAEGTPREILSNQRVIDAYLGKKEESFAKSR